MTRIHRLARAESFERVPETCPDVYQAATKALFGFTKWVDTRFAEQLTEHDRNEIAGQINKRITDLLEEFKTVGTVRLRTALITEIENNLLISLPEDRIKRIEAGEDLEATLTPEDTTRYFIAEDGTVRCLVRIHRADLSIPEGAVIHPSLEAAKAA